MADSIRAIAQISALPGKESDLQKVLLDLVEISRAEPGCLRYELMQSSLTPTQFATWEEWSSEEAMNQHLTSGHVQAALIEAEALLEKPPLIQRYDLIG
jgi:quinol monooxygenase YgiN